MACSINDPMDEITLLVHVDAYPGFRVAGIATGKIFALRGTIHCITQHQPAVRERS